MLIEGRRPSSGASERHLDRVGVVTSPSRSADQLLRVLPGLHQSAHGGRGKAYQYFVRGFDAVHGADVAGFVEGVPLNEASNVHGNGYLDLQLIPTALILGVDLALGSYRADVGDFGVAASADFHLGLPEPGLLALVGAGTDRGGRAALAWRPREGGAGDFAFAEVDAGLGVGDGRAWRMARAAAGAEARLGDAEVRGLALAYDGRFESPGVLRADDVDAGRVSFYGAYPEAGGGRSRRVLGVVLAERLTAAGGWAASGWAGLRGLELLHNFTGYYYDAQRSDGILQTHDDLQLGARVRALRALPRLGAMSAARGGLDLRWDRFHQTEQGALPDGEPWEIRIDAAGAQLDAGLWADARLRPLDRVEVTAGGRVDRLQVWLTRQVDSQGTAIPDPDLAVSGAWVVAPKGSLTLDPDRRWQWNLSYGRGFRSPEARGIEDGDVAPVAVADTAELGIVGQASPALALRAAAFGTWVDNEIVFDHAAGRFLASGATRRLGGEGSVRWQALEPLQLEVDVSWADGRYVADGRPIPYAPRWLVSGVATAPAVTLLGWLCAAGLRGTFLGRRPLPGAFVSHPSFVVDLNGEARRGPWRLQLGVDNLTAARWRDGEFVYPSWFDTSQPRSELPVLHITAGDPFAARLAVGRMF